VPAERITYFCASPYRALELAAEVSDVPRSTANAIRVLALRSMRLNRQRSYVQQRRPFETVAICVLPDHIHAIWQLSPNDADFPLRWSLIKSGFSRGLAHDVPRTPSGNVE
jgi:hypothetical protein